VTLADLTRGQWGLVQGLSAQGTLRQRLLDLGLVPGTPVQALFAAKGGSPTAYYVRGSVFALRGDTASQVLVEPKEEAL